MNRGSTLEGLWERQADAFAGCVVQVKRIGQTWEGRLTYSTARMARSGWQVGDLKWIIERSVKEQTYKGQDLQKAYDSAKGELVNAVYLDRWFVLKGDALWLREPGWVGRFGGKQLWSRLGK